MLTSVNKEKLYWLYGYIQGIQVMGEQCDWERMMVALEKLETKIKELVDTQEPVHQKEQK